MDKTTIAISRESRATLGKIKRVLEYGNDRFVDFDEVMRWVLQNIPVDMRESIKSQ